MGRALADAMGMDNYSRSVQQDNFIPVRDCYFIAFLFGNIYARYMTPFTPHRLGQIIKAYRLEQKLTQAQLATKSGTGLRFIVELERGKPTVQLGKVIAVAEALGLMLMLQKDATLVAAAKAEATAKLGADPGDTTEKTADFMESANIFGGTQMQIADDVLQSARNTHVLHLQNDSDYRTIQLLKESRLSEIQNAFKINPAKPEVEPK
jgi:HTH-type transcriptional regulator / antitoxin HipB